ncbi:MAG: DMT family transporter [Actinomycetota bacterium]
MPILLGAIASVFVGISDTFGRVSSRRADSVSHVATQMLCGVVVSFPATLLVSSEFITRDVLSGALSGVFVASGLAVVYRGMALSSAAVVSPTAAVLAALLPLVWDLIGGTSLAALEIVGCVVAIASLGLTTFNPDLGDRVRQGLILAIAGGLLFGLSIVFAADTSEASGAWPAVSQRLTGFLAMIPLALRRGAPIFLPTGVRRFGIMGGIAGAVGMVAWVIGSQRGDLGTVSVVSSTYPAVVALLAARFDDDQVRWWQAVGIGGAITGGALIALA